MPALVNIARLDFDLMADFRPTFANWNTKQVVAMLVLRYPSKEYERNEVVFWDRIIKRTPFTSYALPVQARVHRSFS